MNGEPFTEIGERISALQDLNKALQIKPDYAEAYYRRGMVSHVMEKYDTAI